MDTVLTRLRGEKGFGLLELLMAMTMLNIGILAIVASFNSGAIALQRASRTATAATLADSQMELYRALTYGAIALDDNTTKNSTDSTYKNDTILAGSINNDVTTTSGCAGLPNECNPSRQVTGADHHLYRVDTYITLTTPPNGRQVKLVTIVIRNARSPYATLSRQQSTFDQSTGS